jgi:hypothetical protein
MKTPSPPRVLAIARGAAAIVGAPVREGCVHSVFRRAANLWVPPNTLLAITAPTAMRVPNGVVVDAPAELPVEAFLGLGVGMTAWVGDGSVRVPAAGLSIDAAGAPVWDPRPQFPDQPIAPAVFSQHLDRLAILIRGSAPAKRWSFASVLDPLFGSEMNPGLSPRRALTPLPPSPCAQGEGERREVGLERLAHRARPAVSDLLAGIAASETDRIAAAARRLAGLGHGLTPSGDDFLIGVCGALALVVAALPLRAGCQQARTCADQAIAVAVAAAGRTTLLSSIWLDHAARGEFSAEVGDMLVSLADTNATGLDEAATRLLAVGNLSGLDTAVGVLLGSRAALSSDRRHPSRA